MKPQLAGLYLRLSREDDDRSLVSQSIQNQREFLLDYCGKNQFAVVDVYTDDGYSGTNFNRPGFLRMLEDIEAKRINVVLTKDLSRLGRDYILTGHYLERYFPAHSVRYIAVNDQIDTAAEQGGSDMTPFRAVFNDLYAKDISKKVRTALDTKRKMGKFIGSFPPYGYRKDPEDKNHLIIDTEQAVYVRRIYDLLLSGETIPGIVERLTAEGIPTPSAVKKMAMTQRGDSGRWNYAVVRRILTMPTYRGDLVSCMTRKVSYKVDKIEKLPRESWLIIPGTHEAIIPPALFEQAQRMLKIRAYTDAAGKGAKLFTGLLYCGDCDSPMVLWSNGKCRYYVCSSWKRAPSQRRCSAHYVRENLVVETVRKTLARMIGEQAGQDQFVKVFETAYGPQGEPRQADRTLEAIEAQTQRKRDAVEHAMVTLYQDKAAGNVGEEEYQLLRTRLQAERQALSDRCAALAQAYDLEPDRSGALKQARELLGCHDLRRSMVLCLIEKITVTKERTLSILFRFKSP